MLFMGEEWGSKAPFPFFCDFEGDLAEAVRNGRRREFAGAYAKYGERGSRPAGSLHLSIRRPRLELARRTSGGGNGWLWCENFSRHGTGEIVPRLAGAAFGDAQAADDGLLTASWRMGDGATLRLLANLSTNALARQNGEPIGTPIWGGEAGQADRAMVGVLASGNAIMPPAIPIATYRLQLTARFDFDAAAASCPI